MPLLFSAGLPTGGAAQEAQGACADAEAMARSLKLEPLDPAEVQSSLTWAEGLAAGDLRITGVTRMSGPCASLLDGVRGSMVFFRNGVLLWRFDRRVDGRLQSGLEVPNPRPRGATLSEYDGGPVPLAGPENRDPFIMAVRVGYGRAPEGIRTDYVGLWGGGQSTVAAFSRNWDGSFTRPKPVLTSKAALRSLYYLPCPDCPSGSLTLTQAAGDDVRLIGLTWKHANVF